jgi:hypothetical protein
MVDLSCEAIAEAVRRDRAAGLSLGELMEKYSPGALVDAFGVLGLSAMLLGPGPVDPETGEPLDYDDSDMEDFLI